MSNPIYPLGKFGHTLRIGPFHSNSRMLPAQDICLSGWARHFTKPDSGILQNSQESRVSAKRPVSEESGFPVTWRALQWFASSQAVRGRGPVTIGASRRSFGAGHPERPVTSAWTKLSGVSWNWRSQRRGEDGWLGLTWRSLKRRRCTSKFSIWNWRLQTQTMMTMSSTTQTCFPLQG